MQKDDKKDVYLNWHPNFRVTETLPDIKVVRTGFMVNAVALVILLVLIGLNVQRELSIMGFSGETEKLRESIDAQEAANRSSLNLSKQFVKSSRIVNDLEAFYSKSYPPLDFFIPVIENRPESVIFLGLQYRIVSEAGAEDSYVGQFSIYGEILGNSSAEIEAVTLYQQEVGEYEPFKDKVQKVTLPVNDPQEEPARLVFTIEALVES